MPNFQMQYIGYYIFKVLNVKTVMILPNWHRFKNNIRRVEILLRMCFRQWTQMKFLEYGIVLYLDKVVKIHWTVHLKGWILLYVSYTPYFKKKKRNLAMWVWWEAVSAPCSTEGERKTRTPNPLSYIWTQQTTITWPPLPWSVW